LYFNRQSASIDENAVDLDHLSKRIAGQYLLPTVIGLKWEHLKYLVWAKGRPIACLAWSSAARHLGSRDRYIGWSAAARRRNLRLIAYNTRFLMLPWIRVPHLASHILASVVGRLSHDWERVYGHPVYFA